MALTVGEVLDYLSNWEDLSLNPLQSVLAQAEAAGDAGRPTAAHAALLLWLGTAFTEWERTFALEAPLATELRRLKPLAARQALVDPDFLVPGRHPLHQLLDNLQQASVGWQARLARAGQACHRLVTGTVGDALAVAGPDQQQALEELNERTRAAMQRDESRVQRMTQRMIEAERGKIRTVKAKRQAAEMINAVLKKYPAPPAIGKFLKGAWYDSAQLVLLKFGADSDEWRQVTTTTDTLLDSVQVAADGKDANIYSSWSPTCRDN